MTAAMSQETKERLRARGGERVECPDCHKPMRRSSLAGHRKSQHGVAPRGAKAPLSGRDDGPERLEEDRSELRDTGRAKGTSRASSTRVSDDKARNTLAKLLIILTVIVATYRLRARNMADRTGALAEELSLSNQEAADIAAPLARWSNSTAIGARVIAPIARNEDVVLSLYALWQYERRTSAWFDEHRKPDLAPVVAGPGFVRPAPEMDDLAATPVDQVIDPEHPFAPGPEYMAQPQPFAQGSNGFFEGV